MKYNDCSNIKQETDKRFTIIFLFTTAIIFILVL